MNSQYAFSWTVPYCACQSVNLIANIIMHKENTIKSLISDKLDYYFYQLYISDYPHNSNFHPVLNNHRFANKSLLGKHRIMFNFLQMYGCK